MASFITLVLFAASLVLLAVLGFLLGQEVERDEQQAERHELNAGWTALESARQVNDVFFHARDAMRQAESGTRGGSHD